jgi:hypothetical protein
MLAALRCSEQLKRHLFQPCCDVFLIEDCYFLVYAWVFLVQSLILA